MNLNNTRNYIKGLINKRIRVKVNIGRNKYEYYEGIVKKYYSNIFIIETKENIKSFSYSDIITKHIIINEL